MDLGNICGVSFGNVVVITFALHAKGPQFEPGRKHDFAVKWPINYFARAGKNKNNCSALSRISFVLHRSYVLKTVYTINKRKHLTEIVYDR